MRTLTLFHALQKTQSEMHAAELQRQHFRGIAVQTDHWARVWQRWHRLEAKLEQAIVLRLGGEVLQRVCMICGKYQYRCTCRG